MFEEEVFGEECKGDVFKVQKVKFPAHPRRCGAGVSSTKHASISSLLGAARPVAPLTCALCLSFSAMRCWGAPYKARINVVIARRRKAVSSFDLCFALVLWSMCWKSFAVVWSL